MLSELPRKDSSDSSPKYLACNVLLAPSLEQERLVFSCNGLRSGGISAELDGDSGEKGRRETSARQYLKLHVGPMIRLPTLQATKEAAANNINAKRTIATVGVVDFGDAVTFFVVGIFIVGEYVESRLSESSFGSELSTLFHATGAQDTCPQDASSLESVQSEIQSHRLQPSILVFTVLHENFSTLQRFTTQKPAKQ